MVIIFIILTNITILHTELEASCVSNARWCKVDDGGGGGGGGGGHVPATNKT